MLAVVFQLEHGEKTKILLRKKNKPFLRLQSSVSFVGLCFMLCLPEMDSRDRFSQAHSKCYGLRSEVPCRCRWGTKTSTSGF